MDDTSRERPSAKSTKPLLGLAYVLVGTFLIGGAVFWVGSSYLAETVTLKGTITHVETDPARGGTGLRWFGSDVVDLQISPKVSPTEYQPYFRLETTLLQDGSAEAEAKILKRGAAVDVIVDPDDLRIALDYLARSDALRKRGKVDETWYMTVHPQFVFAKSVQVINGPRLNQSRTALWIINGLMAGFGLLCLLAVRPAFRGSI